MIITGAILAAGTASRMGRNKLLMPYADHTVIEQTALQLSHSDVDRVLVITGHESERIQKVLSRSRFSQLSFVYNADYLKGRSESIKCAVRNTDDESDGLLFMVGDKPGVSTQLINRALHTFQTNNPALLYIKTPTGRGHPIIFSRSLFPALMLLSGDRIGEEMIKKYRHDSVELEDEAVQVDIDTEADYARLIGRL